MFTIEAILGPASQILESFLNGEAMELNKWCREEHTGCPGNTIPLLPRRAINVSGNDRKTLKLYIPKENERASHATLSYCWGKKPQFTTTLDLVADLLHKVQTIRDSSRCYTCHPRARNCISLDRCALHHPGQWGGSDDRYVE